MEIAYRAQDITEAHIVAGLLRANGIKAHVAGHYLHGAMGEVGTLNLAQVQVPTDDFLAARILIEEYERNPLENEEQYGP
jgi:hypothetical protein